MVRLANSKHCFVCGLENTDGLQLILESPEEGRVTGSIRIPAKFQGWPGIVHGGIIAAILDESAGRTAEQNQIPKQVYLTGTMNVRYKQPVKVEIPLSIEAELIKRRGRVVTARSRILDEEKTVLAEAEIVYVQLEKDYGIDHSGKRDDWIVKED